MQSQPFIFFCPPASPFTRRRGPRTTRPRMRAPAPCRARPRPRAPAPVPAPFVPSRSPAAGSLGSARLRSAPLGSTRLGRRVRRQRAGAAASALSPAGGRADGRTDGRTDGARSPGWTVAAGRAQHPRIVRCWRAKVGADRGSPGNKGRGDAPGVGWGGGGTPACSELGRAWKGRGHGEGRVGAAWAGV
jgi:hypothetical protein